MYRGKLKRGEAPFSDEEKKRAYQERLFRASEPALPEEEAPTEAPAASKKRPFQSGFGEFFSRLDPENAALVILILLILADDNQPDLLLVGALLYLVLGK